MGLLANTFCAISKPYEVRVAPLSAMRLIAVVMDWVMLPFVFTDTRAFR